MGHIISIVTTKTLESQLSTFAKLPPPDIQERRAFVVDPMLATGGSAIAALDLLMKKYGVKPENITFSCLVAAPEGWQLYRRRIQMWISIWRR